MKEKLQNYLQNRYGSEKAKTILDTIEKRTNKDYNFDYYFDYNDEIDEKDIEEFIRNNRQKFDNILEAQDYFRQYIEERYNLYDIYYEFTDEIEGELSNIIDDACDLLIDMRDEFGIFELDYDIFDMCKNIDYRIAIGGTEYHDIITTCVYDGKFKDRGKEITEKKDKLLLQELCKSEGFTIEDVCEYLDPDTDEKIIQELQTIRDNNKFFDELCIELSNTFGYGEDFYLLGNMNIYDLLKYCCVKNQDYNLYNTSYFGFYDHINGSGSTFDGEIHKDCIVDNSKLDIYLASNLNYFDSCYGFTNKAFGL